MKQFIRKLFGIDKLLAEKEQAQLETVKAKQEEAQAKLTPKERATARGEPWVDVLETHVNKDNIRNNSINIKNIKFRIKIRNKLNSRTFIIKSDNRWNILWL